VLLPKQKLSRIKKKLNKNSFRFTLKKFAFSPLTPVAGHQEKYPAGKKIEW